MGKQARQRDRAVKVRTKKVSSASRSVAKGPKLCSKVREAAIVRWPLLRVEVLEVVVGFKK